jgi:hypothetical protein
VNANYVQRQEAIDRGEYKPPRATHTVSAQYTRGSVPIALVLTPPVLIAPYPTDPCLMGTPMPCQLSTRERSKTSWFWNTKHTHMWFKESDAWRDAGRELFGTGFSLGNRE